MYFMAILTLSTLLFLKKSSLYTQHIFIPENTNMPPSPAILLQG